MSEKIKIAVVIDNENSNVSQKGGSTDALLLTQDSSVTLMSVLLQNHLMNGSFCGGRGDCGRCVVQFLEGTPLPTGVERSRLTPEELRQGYRLACVARPKRDCLVRIVECSESETPIVTAVNLPADGIHSNGQQKALPENQKSDAEESGVAKAGNQENGILKSGRYIIAADLGTTTIAMQLRDMVTGETVDTWCERNPQRIYGTDVLARIEASCNGRREELQNLVCESLARGVRQFAAYVRQKPNGGSEGGKNIFPAVLPAGKEAEKEPQIFCMCIAGNTAMEHLLMGYDAESLGRAPFVPVETGLQRITASRLFFDAQGFDLDFPVYIAPCISAFVGGDIVAGLHVLDMLPGLSRGKRPEDGGAGAVSDRAEREKGRKEKTQTTLLIDLGTNGEMAITDGQRMIVTATAAGPAFEGHGNLIGTDRIALTADLLRRGLLDETGLLAEPYFDEGVPVGTEREKETADRQDTENRGRWKRKESRCYFKQEDVRALQMAKAAVRAGVEILWEEMGCDEVDCIYLAGGFGYYLDVEAAFAIGLLPSCMRGRVQAVGNTSLAGAYELGRGLSAGRIKEGMLEKNIVAIESINLARKENFEKLYLKYMNLEEN